MVIVSAASVLIIPALISMSLSVALNFSSCYDGICYHKSNHTMNWYEAMFYCEHDGEAAFVSVQSAAHNTFIYYSLCSGDYCWLGLFRGVDDSWMWMDGSAFYYSNWDLESLQPLTGGYVAVMWRKTSKWHSVDPRFSYYALCMKNETPPNPISIAKSIPQDFSTCYEGICYHMSSSQATWYDAAFYCNHLRDAALVSVHSYGQQQFIDTSFENYWLGLIFSDRQGSWIWMDGSAFTYSNWGTYEPGTGELIAGSHWLMKRWYGTAYNSLYYPLCMMNESTNTPIPQLTTTDPTSQPTPGPTPISQQHVIAITFTEQEFFILLALLIFMCLFCACLVYIARRGNKVVSVVPELQMHAIKDETNFGVEKSHAEGKVNAMPVTSGTNF